MTIKLKSAATEAFERQRIGKEAGPVMEKWTPFIDAEGVQIEDAAMRWVVAQVLENTNTFLGGQAMEAGQTTSVFGTNYVAAVLGMVRQVFPRLIGKEIVSIQPLDRPEGKVFYLDALRDDNSNPASFGSWGSYQGYADFTTGELTPITKGMRLKITSKTVDVGTPKKLLTEASLELLQDLQAYHQLNASDLLQSAAVDEIAREIDGVLVAMVYAAATANHTVTFGMQSPTGYTNENWGKRLQRAILMADNVIYKARGVNGTFLICGANAALELMDLNTFKLNALFDASDTTGWGLQDIGSVGAQFKVLRSRYLPDNEIIVGRKGTSVLDAGAFWLPYVPLYVSERVFDPTTQGVRQSFMSRYATWTTSPDYFARVVLDPNSAGIVG